MNRIGLWRIDKNSPTRLSGSAVELEKHLEDWIRADPDLVMAGLKIVGSQITTPAGRLDLLGLDALGRWVVIEVKRGRVRRETIAQALDYASVVHEWNAEDLRAAVEQSFAGSMPMLEKIIAERGGAAVFDPDQREVQLIVVGTGREPGLERMAEYLTRKFDVPLTIVSFDVFADGKRGHVMAREITEADTVAVVPSLRQGQSLDALVRTAVNNGIGSIMNEFVAHAKRVGVYPRAWKHCIMFAPMENRSKALWTVWLLPRDGKIMIYVDAYNIAEYFPVTEAEAKKAVGTEPHLFLSDREARAFLKRLEELLPAAADG